MSVEQEKQFLQRLSCHTTVPVSKEVPAGIEIFYTWSPREIAPGQFRAMTNFRVARTWETAREYAGRYETIYRGTILPGRKKEGWRIRWEGDFGTLWGPEEDYTMIVIPHRG